MTYIAKPKLHHPALACNKIGFTRRDYEGKISTLCAGCGHDSITAAIVEACWGLSLEPEQLVPARHVLARCIDEDDDRRAVARLHRGQHMTSQQDAAIDPERRTFDDADDDHLALAIDTCGAVQCPGWAPLP